MKWIFVVQNKQLCDARKESDKRVSCNENVTDPTRILRLELRNSMGRHTTNAKRYSNKVKCLF